MWCELRQSEIEDLHPPVFCEEDVFRFEIAMNDSGIVGSAEAACNLDAQVERLTQPQRAFAQAFAQGFAMQQFGDDVGVPAATPRFFTVS